MTANLSSFSANFERYLSFKIETDGIGNGIGNSEKNHFSGIAKYSNKISRKSKARGSFCPIFHFGPN
jgi:hypothetical protein